MIRKNFHCLDCRKDYTCNIKEGELKEIEYSSTNTFEGITCVVCGGSAKLVGEPSVSITSNLSKVKAIYETEKGEQIAIDDKGNTIDSPYEKEDYRGWKKAGKDTKGYERSVIFR